MHMYLITGNRNVQKFFRSSRSFNFENLVVVVSQRILGVPPADARKLGEDNSGRGTVPLGDVGERGRIWQKIVDISHSSFYGKESLSWLADKWITEFLKDIDSPHSPLGQEWTEMPIYKFLSKLMLASSVTMIMGPRWVEECPTFDADIWDFDDEFQMLLIGAPRFLCRRGWNARNRLLASTKRWLARAWSEFDWRDEKIKGLEWEENFGHRVVREREQVLKEYGLSLDGRASFELGLIWA